VNICLLLYISKRLEEQNKIVELLEEDKEKLSQKIYKLEKQLVSQNQHSAHPDPVCSIDAVRIQIKHKVMRELLMVSQSVGILLLSIRHLVGVGFVSDYNATVCTAVVKSLISLMILLIIVST